MDFQKGVELISKSTDILDYDSYPSWRCGLRGGCVKSIYFLSLLHNILDEAAKIT